MTQEDKELLLKDLCARLTYGVKVHLLLPETMENGYTLTEVNTKGTTVGVFLDRGDDSRAFRAVRIENEYGEQSIKPYLRPMSSMTEEEYNDLCNSCTWLWFKDDLRTVTHGDYKCYDWLNAHHFDYRGLIEKGLAIEVTEENNPYN